MPSLLPSALLTLALVAPQPLRAKRTAPGPVPPVRRDGVEYTVPDGFMMGLVAATDLRTGTLLWRRQIYPVRVDPRLETDVQDCWITSLRAEPGRLRVTNDRGWIYLLDLKSLRVRVVKGRLVVQAATP